MKSAKHRNAASPAPGETHEGCPRKAALRPRSGGVRLRRRTVVRHDQEERAHARQSLEGPGLRRPKSDATLATRGGTRRCKKSEQLAEQPKDRSPTDRVKRRRTRAGEATAAARRRNRQAAVRQSGGGRSDRLGRLVAK